MEPVKKKAVELGVTCNLYDIDDPEASKKADELVEKYGDWSHDYLIPQIFIEDNSGEIAHVFTGYSEDVELTRRGVNNLLNSSLFKGSSQKH